MDKCGYDFKITYCFKAFYISVVLETLDKYDNVRTFLRENKIMYDDFRKNMTLEEAVRSYAFMRIRILFSYIIGKLVTKDLDRKREYVNNLIKLFKKLPNDNVIYKKIKDMIKKENTISRDIEKESSYIVENNNIKILNELLVLGKISIKKGGNILDIGTERLSMLERYKENFDSKKVIGINIDEGFCHYDDSNISIKSTPEIKFMIYDGVNIPNLDIKYDLISITSVIHHISDENLKKLLKQINSILNDNGIVFIKDNNINNISSKSGIIIQHMIYEGSIIDSPHNPLYPRSIKEINNFFSNNNLKIISYVKIPNFSQAFYAIYRKF